MKFTFTNSKIIFFLTTFVVVFLLSDAAPAAPYNSIIRCKTSDNKGFRVWKFTEVQNVTKFWTLNDDKFYPFCTQGLSLKFPNGLLCAFKKDRKVGTVATFIDIKRAEITDIMITKDTILEDPNTWTQTKKTACRLIRK